MTDLFMTLHGPWAAKKSAHATIVCCDPAVEVLKSFARMVLGFTKSFA